jgi:Ca2+-transporting ATPase
MDLASSTIFITESAEPDVMKRPPRKQQRFLSMEVGKRILRNTAGLVVAILIVYLSLVFADVPLATAKTAAFSTWLHGHILLALNLKQEKVPLIKQGIFSNKFA